MPSYNTRRRTGHFCFGQPAPLSPFCLPTEGEIYNAIAFKRQELQAKTNNYNPADSSNQVVFKLVATEIMSLWVDKGNLPVIGEKAVIDKIKQVCDKAKALLKVPKERRLSLLVELEIEGREKLLEEVLRRRKRQIISKPCLISVAVSVRAGTLVNVSKKERYLLGSGTFWLIREMTEIK